MGANTLVSYGGARIPDQLADMNLAVERIMKWGPRSITVTQGSRSGAVAASGNTHAGDDAEDLTANEWRAKEKFFRILGGMFYHRPYLKNVWPEHVHGGRDYSTAGSASYRAQLVQYHNRRNALANYGPDEGYRMLVFPKNIYKGYIGYVEATVKTGVYEQQTTKAKKLGTMSKGQVTYVVAETEVAGKRWYVTLTGKCIRAAKVKKIAQPKGATPEKPNVKPKATPAPVATKPAAAPAPAPKPAAPVRVDSVALAIGTRNVIVNRLTPSGTNGRFANVKKGKGWDDRKPLLAKDAAKAGLDFLGIQEAGSASDVQSFAKSLEAATGDTWVTHFGGDGFDISQGNLWNKTSLGSLESGVVDLEGSDHDKLVWSLHRVKATGGALLIGNFHLAWKPGGKSAKGNQYDHLRERQFAKGAEWLKAKAAETGAVVVALGDFNSTMQNPYDGPNKAAAARGFVDCEVAAKSQVRTKVDSYHNFGDPQGDKQFDRFFVLRSQLDSGQLVVTHFAVDNNQDTKAGSDHYQTRINITVRAK